MAKQKLSDQFVVSAQKIVGAEERVNIFYNFGGQINT